MDQHGIHANSYGLGIGDYFEDTSAACSTDHFTTTAANTHSRDQMPDLAVSPPFQGGFDLSSICSDLLTGQPTLAAVPDQQSFPSMPEYFQLNAYPGVFPNKGSMEGRNARNLMEPTQFTGVALPWHGFDYDLPTDFPGIRQHVGDNGTRRFPTGYSATQGKPKVTNMQGKYECWACPSDHGEKPVFSSTGSLRNHERKYHEEPREGGAKPRKVSNRPSKVKQEQVKTSKRKMKKMEKRKQTRMLIGKLQKAKLELDKAEQMLREISLNTDG